AAVLPVVLIGRWARRDKPGGSRGRPPNRAGSTLPAARFRSSDSVVKQPTPSRLCVSISTAPQACTVGPGCQFGAGAAPSFSSPSKMRERSAERRYVIVWHLV